MRSCHVCLLALVVSAPLSVSLAAETQPASPAITSLPRIPAPIHEALQGRDFPEAIKLIDAAIAEKKITAPDYLLYLKGLALTHLGQFDAAIETFQIIEKDYTKGPWLARARFGRAAVFSRQRNYQAAGAIYKAEAERLLSDGRKDELTGIYLEFADRYFEGEPIPGPTARKQPDYGQALAFYTQALSLRPSVTLRHRIELRIARCHHELNQLPQAVEAYRNYLKTWADKGTRPSDRLPPALDAEAQFQLGRAQLAAGQPAEARKTWQDFLKSDAAKEAGGKLIAEATYRLAQTYGMPQPPTVGDLELGVGALERFIKQFPKHELAPQAEFEIAQGYAHHGRFEQVVTALRKLIDNRDHAKTPQVAAAWNLLGQSYASQKKFAEAIAAWREFLDKYPSDPGWSQVQRVIIDTEYAMAEEERVRENYDAARKLWETFLNKYPLDGRAAYILLLFGQMKYDAASHLVTAQNGKLTDDAKRLFEAAIEDWQRLVSKYPGTNESSQAALNIGSTLEDRLGRLTEALEAYKKVEGQHQPQAQQRIANLTAKQLEIVTERKFRSDEKPQIKLSARNLESVTVKIYRIDLADYFRKMHLATGVESLDIALIDPDKSWEYKVEGYEKYRRLEQSLEIPVDGPGVTAVTVSSDALEATTMVVVSDIDIIVKSSRNELFIFAENMRTGKPASGVSLLVSDGGRVFAEEVTGADGVLQKKYEQLKSVHDLRVFGTFEGHAASSQINLEGLQFAVGLSPRGYLYTERPAYRAGQLVHVKGIIRWVSDDRYTFKAGEKYQLDIYDSRGRVLHTEQVALGEFGTVAAHFTLPGTAPQGAYRVHVHQPGREQSYETSFLVHEYQLEPVQFSVDLPQKTYYRGEKVKGKLVLKYYYGTPLAGRTVQYRLGDDRLFTAETDKNGEVAFELETQRYSESQPLPLIAQYPERNLQAAETVFLATRGFQISVSAKRSVYLVGETFDASIAVLDAAGKPIGTDLKVEVLEQTPALHGRPAGERLIQTFEGKADEKTGQMHQTVRVEKSGRYIVRASGTDRFGNTVSGATVLLISGDDDHVRLRILADKHHFKVGETGNVQLHWRDKPTLALVTFEGAEILGYRLVELKTGANAIEIPLDDKLAPNFELAVAVMEGNKFHEARSDFQVSRDLVITLKPSQTTLKPGDPLTVDVVVTDSNGKPVSAELSLALIQKNLLQMFPEQAAAVDQYFNGGARQISVRAMTSCIFRYAPPTRPINLFLLAEEDRKKVLELESAARTSTAAIADAEIQLRAQMGRQAQMFSDSIQLNDVEIEDETMPLFAFDGPVSANGGAISVEEMKEKSGAMSKRLAGGMGGGMGGMGVGGPMGNSKMANDPRRKGDRGRLRSWAAQRSGRRTKDFAPTNGAVEADVDNDVDGLAEGFWLDLNANGHALGDRLQTFDSRYGLKLDVDKAERLAPLFNYRMINQPHFDVAFEYLSKLTDGTVVALNNQGEFQVVNGLSVAALQKVANEGMELVPGMSTAETGYWNPRVVTDKDGKASLVIRLPDRSTAWSLRAKGVTTGSLAGQTETELVTKKELFAEIKAPLSFTVGDKADLLVEVHNSTLTEGTIDVRLKTVIGDKSTELKKQLKVTKIGVEELSFPVEVTAGDSVQFELTVESGELRDTVARTAAVTPYGLGVFAAASGTAAQNTSAIVTPPAGLPIENQKLEILIGPSVNRVLLDAILGGAIVAYDRQLRPGHEVERAVSDALGGVALLKLTGASRTADTPEAQALSGKIQSALSLLISGQRDDGGWSWSGKPGAEKSDRYLTSRVMWALSATRKAGFAVPQANFDKGTQHLQSAFAASAEADYEARAILLHGLAEAGAADFAQANRLHRSRNSLSASGLVHLALTFLKLDRNDFAKDLLALAKGKIPVKKTTGEKLAADPALAGCIPWMQSGVELRALFLMALNETEPAGPLNGELADWLMAARVGYRWVPEKANGPALVALADWFGRAKLTSEKYTLTIFVNDKQVEKLTIDPAAEPSRVVTVPSRLLVAGKPQRINLDIEGRGRFSYSAVLSGFVAGDKVANTTDDWHFHRIYEPAQRLLDGETIPRGFGVLTGSYQPFTNPLTQLPLGERGEVTINIWRNRVTGAKDEQLDYLVYTEPIPAGASVLPDSIRGAFERYEITPGAITFYVGDRPYPGTIQFSLVGYLPGQFKNSPSVLRSFYQPERIAVAKDLPLTVLARGEKSKDEYRLSPQELYEFGKRFVARRDFESAGTYLRPLFKDYRLNDAVYREVVQMLFEVSLAANAHGEVVQYFEIIKEKYPDVEISFENILRVAQAYLELGEYERGYLVYRATAEASLQRESQIAGFLDERGEFLRSVQVMERLLREYPAEAYVAVATYALAQEIYGKAPEAAGNPKLREAKVTRIDLIATAIHMIDHFLSTWPTDPAADQASFAQANALLDLEQYAAAIDRCTRFAQRYPDSKLLDSFWYVIGYSQFALGRHDDALKTCRQVAEYKRKDPQSGVEVAAANQWQAIYIMGQVFHSLGKAADAISEYQKVKDRFADASEAIDFFTRKEITLPEVSTVKPGTTAKVALKFRNVPSVSVKVYRIDLLKFSLLQRNLSRITGINLAGIRPYHDLSLTLGDGKDYRDREQELELPLKEEGAYLVVCQGENLYTSGLVLVSPLALEVQEDAASGRVRVTVKDVVAERYAHNIHVKVIGSANEQFVSGQTDLRGIFVADGIVGTSTVIAKTDANRYAFYRGKLPLGSPPQANTPAPAEKPADNKPQGKDSLLKELQQLNFDNNSIQRGNYRNLLKNRKQGVDAKAAF